MRRAPSFSSSLRRSRKQRLRRTILGVGVGVVVLSITIRACGGDEKVIIVPTVTFTGATQTDGAPKPGRAADGAAEGIQIRAAIDSWFQNAFADPGAYGDGSFESVGELFVGEAGIGFVADRGILTIGDLAPAVRGVEIETQTANIVVYFDGKVPTYATAAIRFGAVLTLRDDASPVRLVERVTAVFERRDGRWVITNYYDSEQRRDAIAPEPNETS